MECDRIATILYSRNACSVIKHKIMLFGRKPTKYNINYSYALVIDILNFQSEFKIYEVEIKDPFLYL